MKKFVLGLIYYPMVLSNWILGKVVITFRTGENINQYNIAEEALLFINLECITRKDE